MVQVQLDTKEVEINGLMLKLRGNEGDFELSTANTAKRIPHDMQPITFNQSSACVMRSRSTYEVKGKRVVECIGLKTTRLVITMGDEK